MIIKFFTKKGGDILGFLQIYPLVKLGLRLVGSVGKCIRAKKDAGEDINLWDYIECTGEGLASLDLDLTAFLTDLEGKEKRKEVDNDIL